MEKLNCWEFKKCGREPGGARVAELGVCPSAVETKLDGFNGGKNSGRACWVVAGTLCDRKVQGTYARKLADCFSCDFYRKVMEEEGTAYRCSREILAELAGEANPPEEKDARSGKRPEEQDGP